MSSAAGTDDDAVPAVHLIALFLYDAGNAGHVGIVALVAAVDADQRIDRADILRRLIDLLQKRHDL